jgi:hypothetical protein
MMHTHRNRLSSSTVSFKSTIFIQCYDESSSIFALTHQLCCMNNECDHIATNIKKKMIYIRHSKYVIKNDILSIEQHGFRRNSSTERVTFKLLNDILQALNNKEYVGGIFCDLEKAFDCANQDL